MSESYCVRFEFRISPPLTHDEGELQFSFLGRPARIRSRNKAVSLRDSPRVVMNIPGFISEEAAWEFARRLQTTSQLAALKANMGIDVGENKTTFRLSGELRQVMERGGGVAVRTPVRGIDVYVPGSVAFVDMEATSSSSMAPSVLFDAMEHAFGSSIINLSERLGLALRMRAEAALLSEPVARFVVAIAAVEALTSEGKWSAEQRAALDKFAEDASQLQMQNDAREELVRRLKTLRQVGVMEGMRRLVHTSGLDEIWPRWKAIYDLRSKVLHGLLHPHQVVREIDEGMELSRQIVLMAVEQAASKDQA